MKKGSNLLSMPCLTLDNSIANPVYTFQDVTIQYILCNFENNFAPFNMQVFHFDEHRDPD